MSLKAKIRAAVAAACVMFTAGAASAAMLDFNELPSGVQNAQVVNLSNAKVRFLGSAGNLFAYNTGDFGITAPGGGICAFGAAGDCAGTLLVRFTDGPVSNLRFTAVFGNVDDFARVKVFSGTTMLASLALDHDFGGAAAEFFGLSGITHVVINATQSTGAGYAYTNWTFLQDPPTPAPIPVPASMPLLAAGLGGLALIRRRRKAA